MVGYVGERWVQDVLEWGRRVSLVRDYADGRHRAPMTAEMRRMLRISTDELEQFNINYCTQIVDARVTRLRIQAVDGGDKDASKWAAKVLADNRLDGMQMDVHDALLTDGDTFVMVEYDNERKTPVLVHEPAFDGYEGIIPIYDRSRRKMLAAVKIWQEGGGTRVNIYYPDRIEKWGSIEGESLKPVPEIGTGGTMGVLEWRPGILPVVHFRNRGGRRSWQGKSVLQDVIPLMDALNRTLVSMVMTAELSAFQIRYALGFTPPDNLTPGVWVVAGEEGISNEQRVEVGTLEQSSLVPFIAQCDFLIDQISEISATPLRRKSGGDTQSGEALKQREVALLGTIRAVHVKTGNDWEDVVALAAAVQRAFGTGAPVPQRWVCRWASAEIRNDGEIIDNALKIANLVPSSEILHILGTVYDWDEDKIQLLLKQKADEDAERLAALAGRLPGFDEFRLPDLPEAAD